MDKKNLSIGTVVKLKETDKKIIIVGFFATNDGKKVFDYCGFEFPKGYLGVDKIIYFDECQINEVIYSGLENDTELIDFRKQLINELGLNVNGNKNNEEMNISMPVFTPLN